MPVQSQRHGSILELVIANPPVNGLANEIRQQLDAAIAGAQDDAEISAIVIRGEGKNFSGGADIAEFTKGMQEPLLPTLVDRIEASSKPVVAALCGNVLGGGLELALACHYRIADETAKLGLPEVKLGLLPGAGGTQRLPRLIGPEAALAMIVSGDAVPATKAAPGLLDAVVTHDLAAEALSYAGAKTHVRRTGEIELQAQPELFDVFLAKNERRFGRMEAPRACVEAVRAATELPLAEGLQKERELFMKLMFSPQSAALRHVFFAERTAAKIDGLPEGTALRPIRKVGVIGAGTMGGGIAMNFLSAGLPVTIVEMQQDALDRGTGTIRKNYDATAAKGRLRADQVEAAMALLQPSLSFDELVDCDLIIEAVYEDMAVKQEVFRKLDSFAKPGAILATNTSFLDVDAIAAVTARPQDVLGLHFFSPANVMKLLEVVRGEKTAPDALATAMDLARRIRKVPVVSGVCYGFIGNRMLIPRQLQAIDLVLEGATPEQIDKVHTDFGFPMGPFAMSDLAGVDIGWHRDPTRIDNLTDALNAAGRWGQKAKAGWYDYDDGRKASPSPQVTALIDEWRTKSGREQRAIGEQEIVARTIHVMINEGAKILEEGIAQRPSDIDVVWVYGYGWPPYTGGPMYWAKREGHAKIAETLERYASRMGPDFSVAASLRD